MDNFLGNIQWSEVGGLVMAIVFVVYIFERAWKLYKEVAHRNGRGKGDKDEDQPGRPKCVPEGVDMRVMAQQVDALLTMHEVFDDDGVRVWYVRRSFYDLMAKSEDALTKISALLPHLVDNQLRMDRRLENLQQTLMRKEP